MGNIWSGKKHNYAIFGFYSVIGGLLNYYVRLSPKKTAPIGLLGFTSTLWIGFILGISGLEAWVKFRAPLLARHIGFDVGRHVFSALGAAEAALASTLLQTLYYNDLIAEKNFSRTPFIMSGITLFQLFYLAPVLERLGKIIILEEGSISECKNEQAEKAFSGIKNELQRSKAIKPTKWVHLSYVLLELVKVGILSKYSYNLACSVGVF